MVGPRRSALKGEIGTPNTRSPNLINKRAGNKQAEANKAICIACQPTTE